jgi:hypothetical protein
MIGAPEWRPREEERMAIVMMLHWAGFTKEQYDVAERRVAFTTDPPEGGIAHAAWFDDDGIHVTDIWESAEAFQTFVDTRLMPVVKGEMQIPGEPTVRIVEAHNISVPVAVTA